MIYREAIEYLHSLTDYEKRRLDRYSPETLDLSRVEQLLDMVGNPHRLYPSVHIAGTKGKGSTSAMIESALRAAGYRTGFYTSPHLHTFRERIRIGADLISREDLVALVEEFRSLIARIPGVTTFEAATAIAFTYFARQKIDVLVAEVGLGGRLDATNVIRPEVTVITSLSLDHTYLLGETLPQIAAEKAGIIKDGIPVVTAPQRPHATAAGVGVPPGRPAPRRLGGGGPAPDGAREGRHHQRRPPRRPRAAASGGAGRGRGDSARPPGPSGGSGTGLGLGARSL